MAGNKFDTQFAVHKPKFYQLKFKDLYDEERNKSTIMNCEICNKPMTLEDYEYCDICGDCLE